MLIIHMFPFCFRFQTETVDLMNEFAHFFELEKIMHVRVVLTQKEGLTREFNYTSIFSSFSLYHSLKCCLR